jgi:hypothetical protein
MRGKNLHEKFGLYNIRIDIKKFWEVAETLPDVEVNGKMINESLFLNLRYDSDGNLKNTFSDISKMLNLTYNQAQYQVERAFRHMLHPYRATKYLGKKISENKWVNKNGF